VEIERKIARYKLRDEERLDDGPKDVEVADWMDGFCRGGPAKLRGRLPPHHRLYSGLWKNLETFCPITRDIS